MTQTTTIEALDVLIDALIAIETEITERGRTTERAVAHATIRHAIDHARKAVR